MPNEYKIILNNGLSGEYEHLEDCVDALGTMFKCMNFEFLRNGDIEILEGLMSVGRIEKLYSGLSALFG